MTLSTRNHIIIGAFAVSLAPLLFLAFSAPVLFQSSPGLIDQAEWRSSGLLQLALSSFFGPSDMAVKTALFFSVILAAGALVYLYYYFEKTHTPEILFLALFAFSLAFESIRATIPLSYSGRWPRPLLIGTGRALEFARLYGLFSLFASSVYAAGSNFQKHGRVLFIIALTALLIAATLPLDDLSFNTVFRLVPGYDALLFFMEALCVTAASASYLVAAYTRNSFIFSRAAIGCVLVAIGRDGLIRGDSWPAIILGALILGLGLWLMGDSIHRHYLWM